MSEAFTPGVYSIYGINWPRHRLQVLSKESTDTVDRSSN